MGEFSWICPKCGKPINGSEVIHLRHIRHGKVLGETVGHHDGYGRVYGTKYEPQDPLYRLWADELPDDIKNYPNTHEEICISEFELMDSIDFEGKVYEGKPYNWISFRNLMGYGDLTETPPESFYELWNSLPDFIPEKIASGTSAYHEYCYRKLTDEEKAKNVISELDPDQGWGEERIKYVNVE